MGVRWAGDQAWVGGGEGGETRNTYVILVPKVNIVNCNLLTAVLSHRDLTVQLLYTHGLSTDITEQYMATTN
jgi:hypothetical protein